MVSWAGPWTPLRAERLGPDQQISRSNEMTYGLIEIGINIRVYTYGYGSIPINTIFSGMNIHLPAILMFTRGTRF